MPTPTLHLICGKIAAGKSTLAAKLAEADNTVLIAEDDWLAALWGEELKSLQDYGRASARLHAAMGPHVTALLTSGMNVVLDFPANTAKTRVWMAETARDGGALAQLHLLDPTDEVCLERLRTRNAQGNHAFAVTEEQFHQFSAYLERPSDDEGFAIIRH